MPTSTTPEADNRGEGESKELVLGGVVGTARRCGHEEVRKASGCACREGFRPHNGSSDPGGARFCICGCGRGETTYQARHLGEKARYLVAQDVLELRQRPDLGLRHLK